MVAARKCAGVAGGRLGIYEYRIHRECLARDFRCHPAKPPIGHGRPLPHPLHQPSPMACDAK
jgi:hypothetical protein